MDFTALTGCCAWSDDDGLGLRMSRWYEQRADAKILCVSWKISVARKCGTALVHVVINEQVSVWTPALIGVMSAVGISQLAEMVAA